MGWFERSAAIRVGQWPSCGTFIRAAKRGGMKWTKPSLGPLAALLVFAAFPALAQPVPPACPQEPTRIVRSRGGVNEYLGSVPGVPELCRMRRSDGIGEFYLGIWRSDWPGAGQAYPVIREVIHGGQNARKNFVTRAWPGMQWIDSFINEGVENVVVAGVSRPALRLAHERTGIEGNTYHSIITLWLDLATGVNLRTYEDQIAGQSYGPDTTWRAVRIERLPAS